MKNAILIAIKIYNVKGISDKVITKYYYITRNRPVCRQFACVCALTGAERKMPMELSCRRVGDYLIPNLALSDPPDAPPLGYYGMRHKTYLKEHRPIMYSQLLLTERLYPLCREIDEAAENRLRAIADKEQAHEIILAELVYN